MKFGICNEHVDGYIYQVRLRKFEKQFRYVLTFLHIYWVRYEMWYLNKDVKLLNCQFGSNPFGILTSVYVLQCIAYLGIHRSFKFYTAFVP
jgi:hypothetical protein